MHCHLQLLVQLDTEGVRGSRKVWHDLLIQRIGLQLRAVLDNVTGLRPREDDFRWYLKVTNSIEIS